ncbi:8490_t:CDS:2, partial [Dentiscutata erythropus]
MIYAKSLEVSLLEAGCSDAPNNGNNEPFSDKQYYLELYEEVKYLEAYIGEVEYSRLEDEAIHSRLYSDEDSKGIAEIKSDMCDGEVEYSRLK